MNPKFTALFALMAATAYASEQADKEKPATELSREDALAQVKACASEALNAKDKMAVFDTCINKITFPKLHSDVLAGLKILDKFDTVEAEFDKLWPAEEDKSKAATVTPEKKESTFSWGSTTMIVIYVVAGIAVVGGGAYAVMRGNDEEEL